ncbi:DEAD/DEAH box helicase family protein [Mycoplasmopsis gallinacea]|nr:DEAD/DEAH box helicase family protein [Mycoplasmopsis gallinacea]
MGFLFESINVHKKYLNKKIEIPSIIFQGLSKKIQLRDYQKEAIENFVIHFESENSEDNKTKNIHTLFHMATGSGKTVIMASLILFLYEKGYRNFLFFVNQTNVIEKTKDNFLNNLSNKYLFNDEINYLGKKIKIKEVQNFQEIQENNLIDDDINICFTTTQKLHLDLFITRENSLTYDDFENKKIVFISDESHHINSSTKKTGKEKELENSWETSIMNALEKNKDSIMLEFTATCDINDKNVKEKYIDKIVFDYPLKYFRESGYTKDFENFATNSTLWDRTLIALVLSEYRKFLFSDLKINQKPVILLKSQKIQESEKFYEEFNTKIGKLKAEELEKLYSSDIEILKKALDYFKNKKGSLNLLKDSLINSFKKENLVIMNQKTDNTKEKQLLVNSLEDSSNHIRAVFTVDMLNEGWDVLNLYDIVRLYDTRQGNNKSGKVGAYTIKEAQLIGRGARYCPFVINDEQEKFKRKYDNDINNEYRILETMYFHSKNDSKYIYELKKALVYTGMENETSKILTYKVKNSFKETDFFKNGIVFSNRRVIKDRKTIKSIDDDIKNKVFTYEIKDVRGKVFSLLKDEFDQNFNYQKEKNVFEIKLKDLDYNIVLGASECFDKLKFSFLKERFPILKTLREFLTDEMFLGNVTIKFIYSEGKRISGNDIFSSLKIVFSEVERYISSIKDEYFGTNVFTAKNIRDVIKDKKIKVTKIIENGYGDAQSNSLNDEIAMNLEDKKWYVYNENYGTSEEKAFVKYFSEHIQKDLNEKECEFYLVKNERNSELAIYSFEDGSRFEPDFFLFIRKKKAKENVFSNIQTYIEPKGQHLIEHDLWKEKFLLEINEKAELNLHKQESDYGIIGVPFFNNELKNVKDKFKAVFDSFIIEKL